MAIKFKVGMVATILVAALFSFKVQAVYCQDPTPSVTPPAPESTDSAKADHAKTDDRVAPQDPAAKPAPTPSPDFWHRGTMTGDWDGDRAWLRKHGIELEFKLDQFYQGVASGGLHTGSEYNGVFKSEFKFDLGKLAGWKYWSAEVQTETRFGGPLLGGTGTISPVNTAVILPGAAGTVFSVTALNFTRLIPLDLKKGDLIAVSFGRYNLLDLVDEHFFGGGGTDKFFNIAQIGPLTVVKEVPLITNGASIAWVRGGEPFITLAILDPNDHSTNVGLSNLFADGVTFYPGINFPVKYFGKTAKHSFDAAVTTKPATPFDAIKQLIIPGPPLNPIQPVRGSWSVSYIFRQYVVEREKNDGWGLFTQLSFANKNTSPITTFFDIGLGGNGLFNKRKPDEFGIAYAFTDLSSVLKENINLLTVENRQPRAEHQVEMFYNYHITPWLRLTGDLQIIRPTRATANTAIIPGGRLEIRF